VEIANYRVLCSQLEAQIHQMHDRGGSRGAAGAAASARGEQRERRDAGPSMAKVLACLDLLSKRGNPTATHRRAIVAGAESKTRSDVVHVEVNCDCALRVGWCGHMQSCTCGEFR
jgi:hypothetical protein